LLTSLIAPAVSHQVWITMLDPESRPLKIIMPSYIDLEPDPEELVAWAEMFRGASWDNENATIVLTLERPGASGLTDNDRRWLRFLREAGAESGCSYRGPFLLLGSSVREVPIDEYDGIPWVYSGHGEDPDYGDPDCGDPEYDD
jgi:hypothetical protein